MCIIRKLKEEDILTVAKLHHHYIPYSFNSRLGIRHLNFIYKSLLNSNDSIAFVAEVNGAVVGAVAMTFDAKNFSNVLLRNLNLFDLINLLLKIIVKPNLIFDWYKDRNLLEPVLHKNNIVLGRMSSIFVDIKFRKLGIAIKLLDQAEQTFLQKGEKFCMVDIREFNKEVVIFYLMRGFKQVEKRGNNLILVKKLV